MERIAALLPFLGIWSGVALVFGLYAKYLFKIKKEK
jgi:hypothetical protein